MTESDGSAASAIAERGQGWLGDFRRARVTQLLRWALVALFIGAGGAKLIGQQAMVTLFAMVGLGQWFRYAVGSYELVGAALLAYGRTAPIGAVALILLMLGAAATETLILERLPLSSGATLLALFGLVAGLRQIAKASRRRPPTGPRHSA